ncbi:MULTISPECIES: CDP-alcohol phosphatidyltransferase family protein [Brucella/Ochrobactrum group]|jgi:CDP-diacylglycerol--glycerol-3-phosphate 3-phosphatidyltransferase|uniref:CDP-alcohol phosphatidyltransferase family protein n=1 Tax=Brucella pseudintermedia TaxID=370111 RepID=A0ABY5UHS0_9HYPH|nr:MULTISPECIES: CDP-alcohol phosphatidyltransferase family protein [Brucella/Ochrobactrum group]KAB2683437.1 CDP-alcohol phosphatidyltransferase family protein [Brucella pseudintermedia]MCO7726180.1 CDP-alcohol phosphatidyltransferase family protein [Brucella intermedia]NKE74042.1 CDP-alcohol phosphatidyltransferase family protein [Ochrobactrum sp. MC-1LL]UWL62908.1 CDP-alcohol phosphatidyltransferase family protein [Brucella pseudintermedia]
MSVYQLKSRFQNLLRPLVVRLAAGGVTANQVTVAAALVSIILGAFLAWSGNAAWFALVPVWLFLRMALNAIDGMLAREHGQKSTLGAYLNEIGDVVSDAALYAPFALVAPFSGPWIFAVIFLATLTEFAGLAGVTVGASRRYDGPMGKSDRAVIFGVLGAWIAIDGALPDWMFWLQPLLCLLLAATTVKRVANGINEAKNG